MQKLFALFILAGVVLSASVFANFGVIAGVVVAVLSAGTAVLLAPGNRAWRSEN